MWEGKAEELLMLGNIMKRKENLVKREGVQRSDFVENLALKPFLLDDEMKAQS